MPRSPRAISKLLDLEPFPQPALVRTRYPVVFFHGFGLIGAIRRQGQLHNVALALRQRGTLAYAPNVAPYNTVRVRSPMWKNVLEHVLEETGAEQVNIIAHSMGGLDARYVISEGQMHDVVASLTTVSTPHRGTPLATWIMEQPGRMRSWTAELINRVGDIAMDAEPSDVLAAVSEMRPIFLAEEFNPAVVDHPSVRYFSYAGAVGRGTDVGINPLLIPPNQFIYERAGLNDGYVPVASAKWGTFNDTFTADHIEQVGIHLRPSAFSAVEFYCSVVQELCDRGL